jgi:hypothetical protein
MLSLVLLAVDGIGQTTWYVDGTNCSGSGDGTPSSPFCTIQEGVDAAGAGDTVLVREGEYIESLRINGKSLSIVGEFHPLSTFLRSAPAGVTPDAPAIFVQAGSDLRVENLSIVGSLPGIQARSSQVALEDCILRGNFNRYPDESVGSALVLSRCSVTLNRCTVLDDVRGGATSVRSILARDCELKISGSTLVGDWEGACLEVSNGVLQLEQSEVLRFGTDGEYAEPVGGAIIASNSTVMIDDCDISHNSSSEAATALALTD